MSSAPAAPDPGAVFARADVLVELRRAEEAVQLLRDALAMHPDNADLWGQLAVALLAAEKPKEAYPAALQRIRLVPQGEWGHRLASLALSQLGQPRQAGEAAQHSVALAPEEWRTHARLARARADEGRFREAWPAAMKAVELAPEEAETHMTVGSVAVSLQDWNQAEMAYKHVLSLEPDNAAARNNLALVTLRRGEVAGAAEGFADAMASDPRADVARRNLEISLRVALTRVLRWQWFAAVAGYLSFSQSALGRYAAILLGAALVALGSVAYLRWRRLPEPVRRYALSLLRRNRRFGLLVGLSGLGFLALVAAVGLGALGFFIAARAVIAVSVLLTVGTALLSGRA